MSALLQGDVLTEHVLQGCARAHKCLRAKAQVDTSGLTLEEGLFRNFDDIIRRQLDAVWHTVSPRTKQAWPDAAIRH